MSGVEQQRGERRHLVPGDLGEVVHDHLQDGVNEGLFELLVVRRSVRHLVVLPLLKPLVVGKTHQTQRGLTWKYRKPSKDECPESTTL